jgi:hypothetical protein
VPALIPVYTQYGITEMADPARVRQLRTAPNAEFVIRHKDRRIMRINLTSYGDDYGRRPRASNPRTDVYRAESDTNPPRVWAFKHGERAGGPQ